MATDGNRNKAAGNASRAADLSLRRVKWFAGIVLFFALIMGLRALATMSDFNALDYRLAALGWGKFAQVIIQNKIYALWHAAFMTVCAGVFIWFFYGKSAWNPHARKAAQWLLVAIVVLDAFFLSRHYIKTMPMKAFEENDVIRVLKTALPEKRAVLLTQEGFYNYWLTYLFPYHGIKTMNVTQMPRMPDDYRKFFEAVDRNPLRKWQLSAVGFVLAPAQAWGQFQNDPAMKGAFEVVYAYNVKPADSYVEVIPATPEQPGQHIIMRLLKPAPRFALIGGWEVVADDEALRRLGANDYHLFEKAMIAPGSAARASLPASGGSNECGQVQVLACRPGQISLRTSSTCPAVLRVADKYDSDWKVWIDGKKADVMRVDFIFQGVFVESGMHEVLLEYSPSKLPFVIQAVGFLLFAGAAVLLLCKQKNRM